MVDADDPAFLPPGDMPARIAAACRAHRPAGRRSPAEMARCILDCLALALPAGGPAGAGARRRGVDVVHIVGGGARNALLCQLTADACGLPVVAGPVEATALGNVLVQARAPGSLSGGLADLRAAVAAASRSSGATSPAPPAARPTGSGPLPSTGSKVRSRRTRSFLAWS